MAIILNDNIKINAGKPSESKYLSSGNTAYSGSTLSAALSAVTSAISISERHEGLTVLVTTGGSNIEYWFKEGVDDINLIEKKFTSEQLVGDFITGATNLGYFTGQTGIQTLDLSGAGFGGNAGLYFSEYNWYYADTGGVITIGSPTHNGPLRRAYVNAARDKSWIYDAGASAWVVSLNDVIANVGNVIIPSTYTGTGFTNTTWSGSTYNGSVLVTAYGSLTTGNSLTIGNPIFKNKSDQDLHLRTIINDTPEFLKIDTDDNYIRFSGVSSVITATNYGGGIGVFSGKTGTNLKFKTLTPSGDTTITQTSDGRLVIYSSSDGSADAITGATNYGSGISVYSGATDRNLHFNTLVGSGGTTISKVGDNVIINAGGAGGIFTEDITVSIAAGKTFGKYENGDVIPASGKTANEVILLSLAEALEPTINLSSSATDIDFGLSAKTVNVTFSYTINTIGANVSSVLLEWRRGGTGTWSGLTTNTGATSYFHTINETNRFNTAVINYRYTVIDSAGGSGQTTYNVIPEAYAPPTISPTYTPQTLETYESATLREIGNVNTTINGNINSNRSLVNLLEYRIERNDGGGYVTIASATSINALSKVINAYLDSASTGSATSILYRISVDDEYTTTVSSVYTINLRYSSYFGYNTTNGALTSGQIVALGNESLLSSRVRTVDPVTAPASNYTFISYPASFGDLTNVILNLSSPVLGAFTKLSNVTVTNFYGQNVSNILYKSNAPEAFTGDRLDFS